MAYNAVGLPHDWCSWPCYRVSLLPTVLWRPKDPENTPMSIYRRHINKKFGLSLHTTQELQRWTVTSPQDFWVDLYSYCGIIPALPVGTNVAYDAKLRMRDIPEFFQGHKLNYAENVLVPNTGRDPNSVALVGVREGQLDRPEFVTWQDLSELVRKTRSALIAQGVRSGDVIAALMSNSIWVIVVFLATAAIGATFTSISPDMGVAGCVSRLAQVGPKILFSELDMASRGRRVPLLEKVREIFQALSVKLEKMDIVFVPTCHRPHEVSWNVTSISGTGISLLDFLGKSSSTDRLEYARVPLSHPLVILYSSGTTGAPKCIISTHGSIIQYKKIGLLHNSLGPHETVFQYSSTSWVVWNVQNGHLSVGAKLVCYDGGALWPDPSELLRINAKFGATYWGTSPRYLLELEQSGIKVSDFDLSKMRMVTTTGATLTGDQMRWFYSVFPKTIHLSSIAGGTDIASSWISSDPAGPLHANEMQMWALGMDCDVADPETGLSIAATGESGELVCRKPFPSMPSGFWGDIGNKKYMESYFESFPEHVDVWAQHDFTQLNPKTGGIQIHGRSDGVLNPSGIRFGSAEIYSIVEGPLFNSVLADSLCVGRRRKQDKDEAVFLFVIMSKGHLFSEELVAKIRDAIRTALSPRHVPKFIFEIDEIPYTLNGKKVEVVVKKIISGLDVKVSSTVVNPDSVKKYQRFALVEQPRRTKL